MADLTTLQHLILDTLVHQSDGYLCSPDASAFVAQGMEDADAVEEELVNMQNLGWVEFYTEIEHTTVISIEKDKDQEPILDENGSIKPKTDEDGNILTEEIDMKVDSGWIILDKGREALKP